MVLTIKEIELVYFGVSIAAGCKPCTTFHFGKLKEAGASDEEINRALIDAVNIRDIVKKEIENHAKSLLGLITPSEINIDNLNSDRLTILVSIGSAFAVNGTSTLSNCIDFGKSAGITNDEINKVFRAAKLVKMKAASHVDKISTRFEKANTNKGEEQFDGCEGIKINDRIDSSKPGTKVEKGCC